jgi:hypothetical protein
MGYKVNSTTPERQPANLENEGVMYTVAKERDMKLRDFDSGESGEGERVTGQEKKFWEL